jgi:hypothetical protein
MASRLSYLRIVLSMSSTMEQTWETCQLDTPITPNETPSPRAPYKRQTPGPVPRWHPRAPTTRRRSRFLGEARGKRGRPELGEIARDGENNFSHDSTPRSKEKQPHAQRPRQARSSRNKSERTPMATGTIHLRALPRVSVFQKRTARTRPPLHPGPSGPCDPRAPVIDYSCGSIPCRPAFFVYCIDTVANSPPGGHRLWSSAS